eukprot:5662971-Amphidinium_carterae.1
MEDDPSCEEETEHLQGRIVQHGVDPRQVGLLWKGVTYAKMKKSAKTTAVTEDEPFFFFVRMIQSYCFLRVGLGTAGGAMFGLWPKLCKTPLWRRGL